MGTYARLGVLCLMGLAVAMARLVEVEFRAPPPPQLTVEAAAEPPPDAARAAEEQPEAVEAAPAPAAAPPERVHVVKAGETLGTIARQVYGTSREWERIYEANRDRIPNPRAMRAGIELRIPERPKTGR